MRIAFVHSIYRLMTRFKGEMAADFPATDSFHILNEALIEGLNRGEPRTQVYRRTVEQLLLAADSGADLVICTSISLAPAVDMARLVCRCPIVNVSDPVSAEAVRTGRRIAVLCNNTTASRPSAMVLRQQAAAQGVEVIIETVVRPEAYTALYAGNEARHDAILIEAAQEVLSRVDVFVLGQATLAPLKSALLHLGKPVLDSPSHLMADIGRRLASEKDNDDLRGFGLPPFPVGL